MNMPITIALVTFNGAKYLPFCLDALLAQTRQDFSVIVIDNGSIDGSADLVERDYLPRFGERMRLVRNRENLGFARAQNQAILWSDSPYVLCLNQDIVLDREFLANTVAALEHSPKAGACSPLLLRWKFDEHGFDAASMTDDIDTTGIEVLRSLRAVDRGAGERWTGQYPAGEIFGASGAAPLYRRAALESVRYLDEFFDADFHSYKEDVDLAYRLRRASWTAVFAPAAVGYHDRTAAARRKRAERSAFERRLSYRNHLLTIMKNGTARTLFKNLPQIAWYEAKKFVYILCREPGTLLAWGSLIRLAPRMLRKRRDLFARYPANT